MRYKTYDEIRDAFGQFGILVERVNIESIPISQYGSSKVTRITLPGAMEINLRINDGAQLENMLRALALAEDIHKVAQDDPHVRTVYREFLTAYTLRNEDYGI